MDELKRCPRCDTYLSLSEFGICRDRKDGLNLYDRKCIREKVAAQRARTREYRARIKRKPCKKSQPVWRMHLEPFEAVRLAIQRGAQTQDEIRKATRLSWDEITDGLARFYDQGLLCRQSLKRRVYKFA